MRIELRNAWPTPIVGDLSLDRFPVILGRGGDCNVAIPIGFISRRHCRFLRRNEEVLVQDLGSLNGTFVNGCPAHFPLPLHSGDEVRLGPMSFRVAVQADDEHTLCLGSTPAEQPVI